MEVREGTVFWGGPAQEGSAQLMATTLLVGLVPFSECISEKSGAWSSPWEGHSQVKPPTVILLT